MKTANRILLAMWLLCSAAQASFISGSSSGTGTGNVVDINGDPTANALIATDGTGNDVGVDTAAGTTTIHLPSASATKRGPLLSADWSAFNAKLTSVLADGKFWVGNGSNVATAVTPSGDVTFTNAGVFAIGSSKVLSAMLAGSIAWSKIATGNNYRLIATGAAGVPAEVTAITASKGLCSDANGIPIACASGPNATEMTYVAGLTSAAQTQINTKLASTGFIEEWGFYVPTAANETIPVIAKSEVARQVARIFYQCLTSGTITMDCKIGGTNITTCSGLSVTSSAQEATCDTGSSNNLAATGQLTCVTTSNSACLGLTVRATTTRD